jgi:hypothetical protein
VTQVAAAIVAKAIHLPKQANARPIVAAAQRVM